MDANDMGNALEKVLISEQEIKDKLAQMAKKIDEDYRGRKYCWWEMLKGATMVMADFGSPYPHSCRNRLDGSFILWSCY